MGEKVDQAVAAFRDGFSCSQAILLAYGEEFGLPRETALRAGAVLGAGMGRQGEVCGAVAGALIVVGLRHGHTEAADRAGKERSYVRGSDFAARFRSLHGTLLCRELLGCDPSTAEGVAEAKRKRLFIERCPLFVRDAGRILDQVL